MREEDGCVSTSMLAGRMNDVDAMHNAVSALEKREVVRVTAAQNVVFE